MSDTARVPPTFDAPLIQHPPPRPTPGTAAPATPAPTAPAPVPAGPQRVFVPDTAGDGAGNWPGLSRLAQLLAHRGAEGPITVAIVGGAGSGKSRALAQVLTEADALSKAAEGKASPFLPGLLTMRLDAADLGADPRAAVAERLHGMLARIAPDVASAAADEASQSSVDPHTRLEALKESLDVSRRRLDAERRAQDEAESRRGRLVETILYESGGSQVDAYARANRTSIEHALTSFGFNRGDTLGTYKSLVQTLCHAGGPAARTVASLKSLWAYRGQTRLIVWAVLLGLLGWGVGFLGRDQGWLASLRGAGETGTRAADAIAAHLNLFGYAKTGFYAAAALCLLACVWRAARFSRPLLRGATLVDRDLSVRRGELDNLVAHHAQRVQALSAETDGLVRNATEAERRASGAHSPTPAYLAADAAAASDRSRQLYLTQVDSRLGRGAAPSRVVVALDDLDSLQPAAALSVLEKATAALRSPKFALVAAFDAGRLAQLGPDTRATLDRLVQIPFRVDADEPGNWSDMVARFASPPAATAATPAVDGTRSGLDTPIHAAEQQLLAALAPLAGPAPRRVKRFVNLYRLGRQDAADSLAAFAFALALATGGTAEEKAAVDAAVASGDGAKPLARDAGERVRAALDSVDAFGRPITAADLRKVKRIAGRWSL